MEINSKTITLWEKDIYDTMYYFEPQKRAKILDNLSKVTILTPKLEYLKKQSENFVKNRNSDFRGVSNILIYESEGSAISVFYLKEIFKYLRNVCNINKENSFNELFSINFNDYNAINFFYSDFPDIDFPKLSEIKPLFKNIGKLNKFKSITQKLLNYTMNFAL